MKVLVKVLAVTVIFIMAPGLLIAQTVDSKTALIKELIDVSGAVSNAKESLDFMLIEIESGYPQLMAQIIDQEGLAPGKKDMDLRYILMESQLRFSKRFRELSAKRLNLGKTIEEIYIPLYDKYFSDNDLKELINFYKSPIGKKFVSVNTDLTSEAVAKSNELLNPKIMELIDELINEEKENIKKALETGEDKKVN